MPTAPASKPTNIAGEALWPEPFRFLARAAMEAGRIAAQEILDD
jgi:hypothetical protein